MVVLVLSIALLLLQAKQLAEAKVEVKRSSRQWASDEELEVLLRGHACDILEAHGTKEWEEMKRLYPNSPIVFRGLALDWQASSYWQKDILTEWYGNRIVKVGSGPSIVYSAGQAERTVTFAEYLNSLGGSNSSFLFDTTILSAIPELWEHFYVPPPVSDWDSPELEANRHMWHMLSIGPSRSGLPFHNHGKTWLAVIQGRKHWFLYPPGLGPPRAADQAFSPIHSPMDWLNTVYPIIQATSNSKPQLHNATEPETAVDGDGFRPLECSQGPGDVLFLPSMWSHLTVNVGETIAIGGQQYLSETERIEIAMSSYRGNSSSYETLKDIAVGIYYEALHRQEVLRRFLQSCPSSMTSALCLTEAELVELAMASMDSIAVVYYSANLSSTDHTRFLNEVDAMARNLSEVIDVVAVPVQDGDSAWPIDGPPSGSYLPPEDRSLPQLVLLYGFEQDKLDAKMKRLREQREWTDWSTDFLGPEIFATNPCRAFHCTAQWTHVIRKWVADQQPVAGTLRSGSTAHLRAQSVRAIVLLSQASAIRPMHPEALHFLCEISRLAGDEGHRQVLDTLMQIESVLDRYSMVLMIPRITFASLYQKIAGCYEMREEWSTAQRLLGKSLEATEGFVPALQDSMRLHIMRGQCSEARQKWEAMKRLAVASEDSAEYDYLRRECS